MQLAQINTTPIEALVRKLWEQGGTDLHIAAGAPPMFRIDGELHPVSGYAPLHADEIEALASALLPQEMQDAFLRDSQLDFSFTWRDLTRFRGNMFRQQGAVSIALRAIPFTIPSADDLLLPPSVVQLTSQRQGLVLMTGPTGSGKSTTLAALVGHINQTQRRHILTLEDPVEYVHHHGLSLVTQREIGSDVPTFADGLKAALREDPDVVLVGEMRDPESIATTLTVAETGHLVFATLHTNDTSTALDRIVDVFPAERQAQIRVQLAAALVGVVAQRLVPRADEPGMIAAFEVLLANKAVRGLIREGKSHQIRNVISQNVREGMQTLEQSLSSLVAHGLITAEDAQDRAVLPSELRFPPPAPAAAPEGAVAETAAAG